MNSQSEQGRGYHSILIVEDDRAVRESLKFSLVIEGFAVRAYADAEHLLAEPRLPRFDCLIVDQNMPGMNGLDLVSALRARHIETPAILITSHPNQSTTTLHCVCAQLTHSARHRSRDSSEHHRVRSLYS